MDGQPRLVERLKREFERVFTTRGAARLPRKEVNMEKLCIRIINIVTVGTVITVFLSLYGFVQNF